MPTCPKCRRHFPTLPCEEQDHPCPRCGWAPWDADELRDRKRDEEAMERNEQESKP